MFFLAPFQHPDRDDLSQLASEIARLLTGSLRERPNGVDASEKPPGSRDLLQTPRQAAETLQVYYRAERRTGWCPGSCAQPLAVGVPWFGLARVRRNQHDPYQFVV